MSTSSTAKANTHGIPVGISDGAPGSPPHTPTAQDPHSPTSPSPLTPTVNGNFPLYLAGEQARIQAALVAARQRLQDITTSPNSIPPAPPGMHPLSPTRPHPIPPLGRSFLRPPPGLVHPNAYGPAPPPTPHLAPMDAPPAGTRAQRYREAAAARQHREQQELLLNNARAERAGQDPATLNYLQQHAEAEIASASAQLAASQRLVNELQLSERRRLNQLAETQGERVARMLAEEQETVARKQAIAKGELEAERVMEEEREAAREEDRASEQLARELQEKEEVEMKERLERESEDLARRLAGEFALEDSPPTEHEDGGNDGPVGWRRRDNNNNGDGILPWRRRTAGLEAGNNGHEAQDWRRRGDRFVVPRHVDTTFGVGPPYTMSGALNPPPLPQMPPPPTPGMVQQYQNVPFTNGFVDPVAQYAQAREYLHGRQPGPPPALFAAPPGPGFPHFPALAFHNGVPQQPAMWHQQPVNFAQQHVGNPPAPPPPPPPRDVQAAAAGRVINGVQMPEWLTEDDAEIIQQQGGEAFNERQADMLALFEQLKTVGQTNGDAGEGHQWRF